MPMHPWVAALAAACLVSGCGFMPPAPPVPGDLPRISINKEVPRLSVYAVPAATRDWSVARTDAQADPAAVKQEFTPFVPVPPAAPSQSGALQETEVQPTAQPAVQPVAPSGDPPKVDVAAQAEASVADAAPKSAPDAAPASIPADIKTVDLTQTASTQEIVALEPEQPAAPVLRSWHIGPGDQTVRQALVRWAGEEGWTFGPDQWLVQWDIPIEASAEYRGETFQDAVQALAESVALTETPVNTCFYGNRVLRVVSYNQSCNRTTSHVLR